MTRAIFTILIFGIAVVFTPLATAQSTDPLPSWNDGELKQSITHFVTSVTVEGSPDFVPSEQRIATFDNDGTLWVEQPVVQLEFVAYQIKKMAPQHPEWKSKDPYKAVLEGDIGQLTYSQTNELPNFQLLINHDDDEREFAYAEKDNASLNAAKSGGWHVVSIKNDWKRVFSFE